MAEASRSQVTITLGRSGQVVKRPGPLSDTDSSTFRDSMPAVGSKRSVRDRLGSNVDGTQLDNNKRQRGDSNSRLNAGASIFLDDAHLNKEDLRFKIMRKNVLSPQSNGQQNGMDLREMLSRSSRSSTTSLGMQQRIPEHRQNMPEIWNGRQHMPESRNGRQNSPEPRNGRLHMPEHRNGSQHTPEPRDGRQRMPETRDGRKRMPEPRDGRQRLPETKVGRQRMLEPRDGRQHMPDLQDGRQRMPEQQDVRQRMPAHTSSSLLGQVPSARSSDMLAQIDSVKSAYSPWTLDRLRRRSPDGAVGTSRGLSPPRNDELQKRPLIRTHDDVMSVPYTSKDVLECSRPMSTASYVTKLVLTAGTVKPVVPLVTPTTALSGIVQKSSYTVDEQPTVEGFLHSLGLDKYYIYFKAEEVDMTALRQMGDNDLKELGIPMGPRKKILLALLSRSKWQVR